MRFRRECTKCKEQYRPIGRNTKLCIPCTIKIRRLTGLRTQEKRRRKK